MSYLLNVTNDNSLTLVKLVKFALASRCLQKTPKTKSDDREDATAIN